MPWNAISSSRHADRRRRTGVSRRIRPGELPEPGVFKRILIDDEHDADNGPVAILVSDAWTELASSEAGMPPAGLVYLLATEPIMVCVDASRSLRGLL